MSTTAIHVHKVKNPFVGKVTLSSFDVREYNTFALLSFGLALLFVAYFVLPHVGFLRSFFKYSLLFMLGAPLMTFPFSVIALKQLDEKLEKGRVMACASFIFSSLYVFAIICAVGILSFSYIFFSYML